MVNRTVVSSALKFGFETEEEKNGQPVIETKTISNRTARGLKAKYKQAGKPPAQLRWDFLQDLIAST